MERVFQIFEGQCPNCEGRLALVEVGGDPSFLAEHGHGEYGDDVEITEWEYSRDGMGERGMLRFKCQGDCGQDSEVYAVAGGDWVAA